MMNNMQESKKDKRQVYYCPVCGAEIIVLAKNIGKFTPYCCNEKMELVHRKIFTYFCSVCGIEVCALNGKKQNFIPSCCNKDMILCT